MAHILIDFRYVSCETGNNCTTISRIAFRKQTSSSDCVQVIFNARNAGQDQLEYFGDYGLLSQNLTLSEELYVVGQMMPAFDIVIRSNPLHPHMHH